MESDDDFAALAEMSRRRDAERDAWEADPANAPELLAPLNDLERQRIRNAVRGAPKRRTPWLAITGIAAAAAAVVLALQLGPGGDAVLPEYGLEMRSQGYSEVRSATVADAWTYADGMTIDLVLRPASAAPAGTSVAVYRLDGGSAERVAWTPEVSAGGSIRLKGVIGAEVSLPKGRSRLAFVVGSKSAVERWSMGSTEGVQVFEREITVREGASP